MFGSLIPVALTSRPSISNQKAALFLGGRLIRYFLHLAIKRWGKAVPPSTLTSPNGI
jgi:hypothetical protein